MGTALKTKRPPTFTTSEYVDVDIDPSDLEEAGWVYVGTKDDGNGPPSPDHVIDTVRRWHDDNHTDPWIVCFHPLCRELSS